MVAWILAWIFPPVKGKPGLPGVDNIGSEKAPKRVDKHVYGVVVSVSE